MSLVDRKKLEKLVYELEESVHESCARVPDHLEHEDVSFEVPRDEDDQTEVTLAEIGFVVQLPGHRLE